MENEKRTHPTKKQFELLSFIGQFIAEKGYGPSYREIMVGCNYSSVATVAVHVNNLVTNGHLIKKDRSARSLEVTDSSMSSAVKSSEKISSDDKKWLVQQIEHRFQTAENNPPNPQQIDDLYVLVGTLKVLGLAEAAQSFIPRLSALKNSL